MLRNRLGRFVKKGHKRHRARKRRSNPHRRKHHARRRGAYRRRRSNPSLLLANPSSGQQSFSFAPRVKLDDLVAKTVSAFRGARKSRKRKGAKRAGTAMSTAPRRKRRRYKIYRGRGRTPKYRIYRRSNPFGTWLALARIGAFGGLGIVTARIGGRLYTDKLSKHVLGATGAADPKSMRSIINEGLRIIAMGALPIVVERQLLRRLPMVTASDAMAFSMGGLAEAGRQAIGVVLKKVKPGLDAGRYGLDGPMPYDSFAEAGGMIYGRHPSGQWYAIGTSNGGMSGLMARDAGFAGAMASDEFDEDADVG